MERDLTTGEFKQFRDLIYSLAGIHYPDAKITLLSNRIRKRLGITNTPSYDAYLLRLKNRQDPEVQQFLDSITTNETYFFRCQRHWDFFEKWFRKVTGDPVRRRAGVRIWSAACSTGAEAYTATIVMHKVLGDALFQLPVTILGTDLSERVLADARRAVYRPYALTQTPRAIVDRYFKRGEEDTMAFDERLAKLVKFQRHNLMDPAPARDFDFVFLRNVMIYFDEPSKVRVLRQVHDAMKPDSQLLVGESESLLNLQHDFRYASPSLFTKPAKSPAGR